MITFYISTKDREICLDFMEQGEKVKAIKHARQSSGSGLKEAKDWCESLCQMHPYKVIGDTWKYSDDTIESLSDRMFSLVEELVEVYGLMKKLEGKGE